MTDKITLSNVSTFTNDSSAVATVNANNALITTAFDNTLSRDGTSPNTMGAQLDMNGFNIINLPAPVSLQSPVRVLDVTTNGATISVPPTGTSGHVVPFLDGNNTTSGNNVHSGTETYNGTVTFNSNVSLGNSATSGTPVVTDNSTTVATTAYVKANLPSTSSAAGLSVLGVAGTATAVPAAITGSANKFLGVNSAGNALAFQTMSGDATLSTGALTLATVNSTTGSFGDATHIPTVTVNNKGLVTAASQTALTYGAGSLTGTALPTAVVSSSLTTAGNTLNLGASSATPAASTLGGQNVLTGTSNTPGTNLTINGGIGTGTGAGGKVQIGTAAAGSTGSTLNGVTNHLVVDAPGNVVAGTASQVANAATDGFMYIPTVAGTPSGTPTSYGIGVAPHLYDTTANKMWVYNPVSSSWHYVTYT